MTHFFTRTLPLGALLFISGLPGRAAEPLPPQLNAQVLDFMRSQGVESIEIKPGTTYQRDKDEAWLRWAERTVVTPFAKLAAKRPKHEKEAVDFVRQALRFRKTGVQSLSDLSITPVTLAARGESLLKAGVDEPLVLMLTAWATQQVEKKWPAPLQRLEQAATHHGLKSYPACTRAIILSEYHETQDENSVPEKLVDVHIEAVRESFADGSTYSAEDEEIQVGASMFMFERSHFNKFEKQILAVCELPNLTEWVKLYLRGSYEKRKAWQLRGGGYANTVTEDGWKGFAEHLPKAREAYVKAWEMHPDRPQPAAAMIAVVMGGAGKESDTERLWFDRAIAAQADYGFAYRSLVTAMLPRWGGSHSRMLAFGLACAQTGQHETWIPFYLPYVLTRIDSEIDDWRPLYRNPLVGPVLMEVSEHRKRRADRAWEVPQLNADQAVYAWVCGDYKMADTLLKANPEPFPASTRRRCINFRAGEIVIRAESALFAAGLESEWKSAEKAMEEKRLDDAEAGYKALTKAMGDAPPAYLATRLGAIDAERSLNAGGWVPLKVTPGLEHWSVHKGQWEGMPEGVLVNHGQGESAFILYNARVGRDFEIRGEYEVISPRNTAPGLGVVLGFGYVEDGKKESWIQCLQYRSKEYQASILNKFTRSNAPHIVVQPQKKWTFHIRCKDGLIDYTLNGEELFKDHKPTDNGKDGVEVLELQPDGRVGFSHFFFAKDNQTRLLHAEVKRL